MLSNQQQVPYTLSSAVPLVIIHSFVHCCAMQPNFGENSRRRALLTMRRVGRSSGQACVRLFEIEAS
jgi:hypothetical protein